jgi:hypothetical protein
VGPQPVLKVLTRPLLRAEPHKVLSRATQAALGATLGLRLGGLMIWGRSRSSRAAWLRPCGFCWSSLTATSRSIGSYLTAGGYLGAGVLTGLGPGYVRLDYLGGHERSSPLPTAGVTQTQFNVALGLRL